MLLFQPKFLATFIKTQASACVFGLFILSIILLSKLTLSYIDVFNIRLYRYDILLLVVICFQCLLLKFKLESSKEFLVIICFHLMALVMEIFKVKVGSWVYPEPALFSVFSVPLFAGFMYSAVGSYIARIHNIYQVSYQAFPNISMCCMLVIAIYINFFSHHYIADIRWFLLVFSIWLFRNTKAHLKVGSYQFRVPLLLFFFFIAIAIWLAENIATYSRIWLYPNQIAGWKMVSYQKIIAWYLLMLLSYVMVVVLNRNVKDYS